MRVGIDARLYGTKHGGIGRYVEELIKNLQKIDKKNEYVVFCKMEDFENISVPKRWRKAIVDVKHYTLKEQTVLPDIFNRENLDLLHVPHFNAPLFYKRPFIVTIHDITWHKIKGVAGTTLPAPLYWIKHIGYRLVLKNAVKNSQKIIVPSRFVKTELVKYFKIPDSKIVVTYEGVSIKTEKEKSRKAENTEPYIFYVGSLYPHKNIESVVLAIKHLLTQSPDSPINLIIVCGRDIFWKRFKSFLKKEKAEDFVKLIGHVSDEELGALYKGAKAFIFPSLSEGFGLPGLEAMAAGTPVLASNIPVFYEVYKDVVIYFDPKSTKSIVEKIQEVLHFSDLKRQSVVKKGKERAKKFSWEKMAKETLKVYENCFSL